MVADPNGGLPPDASRTITRGDLDAQQHVIPSRWDATMSVLRKNWRNEMQYFKDLEQSCVVAFSW